MRWRFTGFLGPGAANWLGRPLVAAVCLLFFLLYWRQDSAYRETLDRLRTKLQTCRENSESLLFKLQVLNEHKRRLEMMFNETKMALEASRSESAENRKKCQLESLALKSCSEPAMPQLAAPSITLSGELVALREKLKAAEDTAAKREDELVSTRNELQRVTGLLDECRKREETQHGLPPRADYMKNGSAHFARQHKQNEALAFNRDAIVEAPMQQLLPPKELMEKLKQREEEKNLHPDDRAPDAYVHEQPDENEKDYKEGEH